MRIVFDTNVLVSAILWSGAPQKVVAAAIAREDTILASEALFHELKNVLFRPKFAPKFARSGTTPQAAFDELLGTAELVEPAEVPPGIVRDEKDRFILACAVGGRADTIVSGDKDLVVLSVYEGIPVMTADQFLQHLSTTSS